MISKYEAKINIVNAILQLIPDSFELRWDGATLLERQGCAKILKNESEEALTLFRQAIKEKRKILSNFKEKPKIWEEKKLSLAKTWILYAKFCRDCEYYMESRDALVLLIEFLNDKNFASKNQKFNDIIQECRQMLDETTSPAGV